MPMKTPRRPAGRFFSHWAWAVAGALPETGTVSAAGAGAGGRKVPSSLLRTRAACALSDPQGVGR